MRSARPSVRREPPAWASQRRPSFFIPESGFDCHPATKTVFLLYHSRDASHVQEGANKLLAQGRTRPRLESNARAAMLPAARMTSRHRCSPTCTHPPSCTAANNPQTLFVPVAWVTAIRPRVSRPPRVVWTVWCDLKECTGTVCIINGNSALRGLLPLPLDWTLEGPASLTDGR